MKLSLRHTGIATFCFAAGLIIFQYIFGLQNTNVRMSSFLAPLFGIMWGLSGSIGVGVGNFVSDLFNPNFEWDAITIIFYVFGSIGNFLMAYGTYRLWHSFMLGRDENPFAISLKNMIRYIVIQFGVVLTTGIYFTVVPVVMFPDAHLTLSRFSTIVINNFDVNVLFGLPILLMMMSSGFEFEQSKAIHWQDENALRKPIYYRITQGFCIFMLLLTLIMSVYAFATVEGDYSSNAIWLSFYENTFLVLHFTLTIQLILIWYIEQNVIRPLSDITKTATTLTHSDLEREKISFEVVRSGDEIELLSQTLHKMLDSIYKYIDNLRQTLSERARTQTQLEIAKNIQASLLPSPDIINDETDRISVEAIMQPALMIGGDFYDLKMLDEDHVVLVVSDISDKGIPASLFMTITHTLIHHKISSADISLTKIFSETNNQLCENNDTEMFATAVAVLYEISTGRMTYVNAGHTSPLIVHRDGSFEYLKKRSGAMLGSMEDIPYKKLETQLTVGDVLILYSDGVTEALNEQEDFYLEARLAALVSRLAIEGQKNIADAILHDIKEFAGAHDQSDDITIVTMTVRE